MRRASAPSGPQLAVLLLFATIATASSQLEAQPSETQEHLVCKKPDSQQCVTWQLKSGVDPDTIIKESPPNATQLCGISSLKRILPHRKFITVKSLARRSPSKIIFCKGFTKLKGDVVNWRQVEKALNALSRSRRQTGITRGRYRGQTQSQYLAIDRGNGKDEGKAEAHSAADHSRASVSGNSGMGQAQSQSVFDPSCDDCYGKSDHGPESLKTGPYVPGTSGGSGYGPNENKPGWNGGINGGGGYGPPGSYGPGQGGGPNAGGTNGYGPPGHGATTGPNQQGGPRGGVGGPDSNRFGSDGNGPYAPGYSPGGNRGGVGGYGPGRENGGNQGYGPGQGSGPGTSGYGLTPGSQGTQIPGQQGGPGYGPGQGSIPGGNGIYGPGTGYTPGRNGDNGANRGLLPGQGGVNVGGQGPGQGRGDYGNVPGQNGQVGPGRNGVSVPGQGGIPGRNTFNVGQSGPSDGRGFGPGQNGLTNSFTPGQGPGQPGLPGGSYGSGPNGMPGGNYGSKTPGGLTNGGYGPIQGGVPGNYGTGQPGGINGYGPRGMVSGPGGYGPGQGNIFYPPGNTGAPGSSADGSKIGSNWPLAQGPYPGPPGTSVYCCVVPNNYGQTIGNGGNLLSPTSTGYPQYGGGLARPESIGRHGIQTPYGSEPGAPNNILGPVYVPGGTNSFGTPGTIGAPVNQGPYGAGVSNGSPGPYGTGTVGGPTTYGTDGAGGTAPYGTGTSGGRGGQNTMQFPGVYGPGTSAGPGSQTGIQGPGTYGTGPTSGSGGQNGMQGPGSYITGTTGGPGGQNGMQGLAGPSNMQGPGTYGTGATGGPRGQHGLQGPGTYGTGTTGGLGGPNGMQGPGIYGTGTTGSPGGQNALQGPGIYGSGSTGGPGGQNGIQGPGSYVVGGTVGPGQTGMQGPGQTGMQGPGQTGMQEPGQTGMPGPGNYGPGTTGGLGGQVGIQGPGSYGTGTTGGPGGQNGMQGPGIYGTGSTGGPGGQNGMQGPGTYGAGTTGGPGGQNGMQGPETFGTGTTGGPGGQNGMQGPGTYGTGRTGGPGGQVGMQGPGSYGTGTAGGPGVQNGMQGPGIYGTGTTGGPGGQNGVQGSGSPGGQDGWRNGSGPYGTGSDKNVPYQPGGRGNSGGPYGPGAYGPGSHGPGGQTYGGGGNTGVYGNQQGPFSQGPGGNANGQYGFDSQGNPLPGNENNGIPQNYMDPNAVGIDGDDSEAEASVAQAANGTTASASSKGGNDKGRAQTHVHGTYTGGGSFQAQAQITGENKEAGSEVSGGKKGASSSATGAGRNNKSQASVQLGSETGSVQTQSQSTGAMHSSNSQVQGSVKGGMADAQAKGPGSTSSQAQIGFTPYKDGDKAHEIQQTPFVGGGVASAQSSGRTGQSQSQLHGTFRYGITYNGAAQAGASIDKDAVFPNRLAFDKIDVFDESQKNINVNIEDKSTPEPPSTELVALAETPLEGVNTNNENEVTTQKVDEETMKNSESRYSSHTHLDHHNTEPTLPPGPTPVESRRSFQSGYGNNAADYEYTTDKEEVQSEEYDSVGGYAVEGNDATPVEQTEPEEYPNYDEDHITHESLQSLNRKGIEVQQTTGGNTQHIVLGSLNSHDAKITQKNSEKPDESKVYQPGEQVPGTGGYRIPSGFTGSVKSVASKEKTYVVGSKHSPSQAQTVTLTPGTGKVNYLYPPSYSGKYVNPKDLRSLQSRNPDDDRYVSVSKSVTRALDGENNIRKQYSHTYYTKSSSCGYFTFTCTMVSGADGKKKVCKPKIPTNPDGTPIRC